jgi:hypothetical protein
MENKVYILKGKNSPPVLTIQTKHTRRKPLLWFDEKVGHQRELRYATNQNSPFVDEQRGVATLGHVVFKHGQLVVPDSKPNLQKFLAMHPKNETLFFEYKPIEIAENQTELIELEFEALSLAKKLNLDELEAIMRVEIGSKVRKMSSKEIKRDALMFAKRKPAAFIMLAGDDNVQLRNIGIKAVEANILKLSPDNRVFSWGSNGRKLFTVPFEEHPYSALAAWLKTDEGLEVLKALEKKLK